MYLLIIYCIIVAAASVIGGLVPALARVSHTHVQLAMSFVGGLMLGVAVLHLLPHGAAQAESLDLAARAALLGLVATFLLIRFLAVHQHGHHDPIVHTHDSAAPAHRAEHHQHEKHEHRRHRWWGLLIGLSLHTVIDGMALAASVAAESHAEQTIMLAGLGTMLAIALHKPMDSLSVTTVMVADGAAPRTVHVVNVLFALLCPLAAIAFYFGVHDATHTSWLLGGALGFAAGSFLCISLADILPEIQFHAHDRFKLTAALLAGVALAYAIGHLEAAHMHDH